MDLGWLVIPLTFLVGFLVGKLTENKIGIAVSAISGAITYVVGSIVFMGAMMTYPFFLLDFSNQALLAIMGTVWGILGWFIGENYEVIKKAISR